MNENDLSETWEWVTMDLDRLSVPGGWLYRDRAGAMAFVPNPFEQQKMMEKAVYNALMWLMPKRPSDYGGV